MTEDERAYAEKAFAEEITKLEQTKEGGRNDQLNASAFKLGQLVAAGALDEHAVREALFNACLVCGHLQHDGKGMVMGSIESGMSTGRARWQPLRPIFRFRGQRIACDDIGAMIVTAPNTGFFIVVPQRLQNAHVLRLPTTTFTAWRWFASWPFVAWVLR